MIVMEKIYQSISPEATQEIGKSIGQRLRGGEILQLVGDLGSGKTTFVAGLVAGCDSKDAVSSPTFTVCQVYRGRKQILHFDFYRLNDDQLIAHELQDVSEDDIIVAEWPGNLSQALSRPVCTIHFLYGEGELDRTLKLVASEEMEYLIP